MMSQMDEQSAAEEQCLTKEQVLAADDLNMERVNVPEWGGHVFVRVVRGEELDAFQQSCQKGRGPNQRLNMLNFRARFVALVACDKDGKPLFKPRDAGELGKKSARALDRVFTVGQRVNGITEEELEDLVGNSISGPSDDSGSS